MASATIILIVATLTPSSWTLSLPASRHRDPTRSRKRGMERIFWLHVPKVGTAFGTTLAHHACDDLPDDLVVLAPDAFFEKWSGVCPPSRFGRFAPGHEPLPADADLENTVVMFRKPEQRILSGYYANPSRLHSCAKLRKKYGCNNGSSKCRGDIGVNGSYVTNTSVIPPHDYADCVKNCVTNLLNGKMCDESDITFKQSVARATRKVEEIGFVGLTDEWDLSVCLWHAKFGGSTTAAEISHLHVGASSEATGYDEQSLLGNWHPQQFGDDVVYQAAQRRFWSDVKQAGISRESCHRSFLLLLDGLEGGTML